MSEFANKTFFKFFFGFLSIVGLSFLFISGASYVANVQIENNTAVVNDTTECAGDSC